jgi:predicted transcriptional regulator
MPTPTFIAEQIKGKPYHSSWSSPILLRLAEKGLVERKNPGHYKITNWGISYVVVCRNQAQQILRQGSKIVAKYEGKTIL